MNTRTITRSTLFLCISLIPCVVGAMMLPHRFQEDNPENKENAETALYTQPPVSRALQEQLCRKLPLLNYQDRAEHLLIDDCGTYGKAPGLFLFFMGRGKTNSKTTFFLMNKMCTSVANGSPIHQHDCPHMLDAWHYLKNSCKKSRIVVDLPALKQLAPILAENLTQWGNLQVFMTGPELDQLLRLLPNDCTYKLQLVRYALMRLCLHKDVPLKALLNIYRNNIPLPVLNFAKRHGFQLEWIDENRSTWLTIPMAIQATDGCSYLDGIKPHAQAMAKTIYGYCSNSTAHNTQPQHLLPFAFFSGLTKELSDGTPTTGLEQYLDNGYAEAHNYLQTLLTNFSKKVALADFSTEVIKYIEGSFIFAHQPGIWKISNANTGEAYFIPDYDPRERAEHEETLKKYLALGEKSVTNKQHAQSIEVLCNKQ